MADLLKTVAIIFQGDDKASAVAGNLAQNLNTVGSSASDATPKLDKLSESAEGLGKSEKSVLGLSDAIKALATSLVVNAFIDANVEAEKFERAMTLLKGSTTLAAEEFTYIKGVANTLGIELFAAADAYIGLAAATKGTALEGQGARDIFEAVSKAMAVLGKSSADTQGALLAISQIVSKGNVSLEELRGQLGERLPGAFQIAAKSMGLTTAELDKLVSSGKLTAEEFLPKFATALRETFGDTTPVEGYTAALNRLKNSISESFIALGDTGAFDLLTKGIEVATAAVVGAITAFDLLGKLIGTVAAAITTGNFTDLGSTLGGLFDNAADKVRGARDAMLDLNDETKKVKGSATDAGSALSEGASESARALEETKKQSAALDKSLKDLGLDPKKFKEPLADIVKAFEDLAANPAVRGDQVLAGLTAALKSSKTLDDINQLGSALTTAFVNGRLSADDFAKATVLLGDKQEKLVTAMDKASGASKANADAVKRQADETKRAQENAAKMALELEKLASNERIKNIEAVVSIKTAQLEADTKKVIASFESIDNTVNSTGELLGDLFKLLGDYDNLSFGSIRIIEDQIEQENARRQEALNLQKRLIEAQIEQIRAQTRNLEKGDPIIKIDGAGLQPHLEAFMFEILRTLQVRVNQDGLAFLLGAGA
jgi:tape measure domain-containing protein